VQLFRFNEKGQALPVSGPRWRPGEGAWFDLAASQLRISAVAAGNG
jgi:hypothetical protein